MQGYPIRVTITQPESGIRLSGGFAAVEGLGPVAPRPELRFIQLHDGRDVVLRNGVLHGEGFEAWLQILRRGGAVTSVEVVFEQQDAAGRHWFHVPEAWLDRIFAPGWRKGATEIPVERMELACDAIYPHAAVPPLAAATP